MTVASLADPQVLVLKAKPPPKPKRKPEVHPAEVEAGLPPLAAGLEPGDPGDDPDEVDDNQLGHGAGRIVFACSCFNMNHIFCDCVFIPELDTNMQMSETD